MKYTEEKMREQMVEGMIDTILRVIKVDGCPVSVHLFNDAHAEEDPYGFDLREFARYSFNPLAETCELHERRGLAGESYSDFVKRMGKEFEAWRSYKLLQMIKERGVNTISMFARGALFLECQGMQFSVDLQQDTESLPYKPFLPATSVNIALCKKMFDL